jgi:DNA-3-methyladenine glycosylase I
MPQPTQLLHTDENGIARCWWCAGDQLYLDYHDKEWGFPVADDFRLFEKICLEGFQAGLSWLTILRKREDFRRAFKDFDYFKVARFNNRSVERLLNDAGIIRHRGKIESTINNAKRAIELTEAHGSLAPFVWQFEPQDRGHPKKIPSQSPESVALSKALKAQGWTFIGPTTVYAFMQAMGMVNDHVDGCVVRAKVNAARRVFKRPSPAMHC